MHIFHVFGGTQGLILMMFAAAVFAAGREMQGEETSTLPTYPHSAINIALVSQHLHCIKGLLKLASSDAFCCALDDQRSGAASLVIDQPGASNF